MKKFSKQELQELAKGYVPMYPDKKTILATEDGNFFFDKNAAINHKNVSKLELFEISLKDDLEAPVESDDPRAEAIKQLFEMDLKNADAVDYHKARIVLEALMLEPESLKKEDVIASLKEVKEEMLIEKDAE